MNERGADDWHWEWSCRWNARLGGDPTQPLCARVYLWGRSIIRTLYLDAMEMIFFEPHHCERVWRKWCCLQEARPVTGRTGPDPGY